MADHTQVAGLAAPLPIANLDTDQIMPKQFLRGIDKRGLDRGLLYDLRFDGAGQPRADFVLNQPAWQGTRILVADPNFGCGSSREHAVWGLLQYGIQAVIAASYGEIFYSNAMNNRLLPVILPAAQVGTLMAYAQQPGNEIVIDVQALEVRADGVTYPFTMGALHQRLFLAGTDLIGLTLQDEDAIVAFEQQHYARQPWVARSSEPG